MVAGSVDVDLTSSENVAVGNIDVSVDDIGVDLTFGVSVLQAAKTTIPDINNTILSIILVCFIFSPNAQQPQKKDHTGRFRYLFPISCPLKIIVRCDFRRKRPDSTLGSSLPKLN